MPTVRIGSHEINIPDTQLDGLTGARFKEMANVPADKVLIERGPNGNQVVRNDDALDLTSGQQFLEVNRFRTAGRKISRINEELRLLVAKYGDSRVHWLVTLEWVLILDWPLPSGWSRPTTNLVVFLPDNYGFGASLRDCVIDPGLQFFEDGEWVEPPHYYGGEKKYMPESLKTFANKDWRYLCVHAESWKPQDSIFTYLESLQLYLSNPNYDWQPTPSGNFSLHGNILERIARASLEAGRKRARGFFAAWKSGRKGAGYVLRTPLVDDSG